jgi:hypothetical protein
VSSAAQFQRAHDALNILAKWRTLFTGWQLGTRPKGDPECDAVSDHREATILLRAEGSALVGLLLEKGVFTDVEWAAAMEKEAKLLNADYERRFPGVTASAAGLHMDKRVLPWMKGWKP